MFARVARWEGADADMLEKTAAEIRAQAELDEPTRRRHGDRVSVEKFELVAQLEA